MTAEIASARVHVERTIQRMKIFKILNGRVGLSLTMVPYMDSIEGIIVGIVNLSAPILSVEKFEVQSFSDIRQKLLELLEHLYPQHIS